MELKAIEKNKVLEITFLIAYTICCFVSLAGASQLLNISENIKIILYGIAFLILLANIISNKFNWKQLVFGVIFGVLSIYCFFKVGEIFILVDIFVVFALKNKDIKKIVKVDLTIKIIFLLVHCGLYITHYFFNYEALANSLIFTRGEAIRHSMYFTHPNIFSSFVFWLLMDVYILKEKFTIIDFGLFTGTILAVYLLTNTRTILILYILFLLLHILKEKNLFNKLINFGYKYLFEIFTITTFSIIVLYWFGNSFITNFLDSIISQRAYYMYQIFSQVGLRIFPTNVLLGANGLIDGLILDNFYARLITIYGLIFIIPLIILTKKSSVKFNKNKIYVILFAIFLLSESSGIIIGNSIGLLLLANEYFNGTKNDIFPIDILADLKEKIQKRINTKKNIE